MPKSFRLEPELEKRLETAAKAKGVAVSAFIREAVERQCDEVLGQSLERDLGDLIGAVESQGGRARKSGAAFGQLLKEKK